LVAAPKSPITIQITEKSNKNHNYYQRRLNWCHKKRLDRGWGQQLKQKSSTNGKFMNEQKDGEKSCLVTQTWTKTYNYWENAGAYRLLCMIFYVGLLLHKAPINSSNQFSKNRQNLKTKLKWLKKKCVMVYQNFIPKPMSLPIYNHIIGKFLTDCCLNSSKLLPKKGRMTSLLSTKKTTNLQYTYEV
jgi:hypothetical protein